jgi:hypothetical protein
LQLRVLLIYLLLRYGATQDEEPQIDDEEFERIRNSVVKSAGSGKRSGAKAKKK